MRQQLHRARVGLIEALNDEWEELALEDREKAKLLDEIGFAKYFVSVAEEWLKETKRA